MDRVLEAMIDAARAGGEVALHHFRRGVEIGLKADRSPVTIADHEAEAAIVESLRRTFPDHGVLGEESGSRGSTERRFIVDPIDGTRNFVRGIPIWAVMLALEEQGAITAGVIWEPIRGNLYTAGRGQGAFRDGERIRVSSIATLAEATLLHATLNALRRDGLWDGFVRLVDATSRQRGLGDYLCYTTIAEGKAEVALAANVKVWDLAAAKILLEEAGGRLTDAGGRDSLASGTALASNGLLHEAALRLLAGR
ncbi:MAG: inositol monophosphatase family protein [candidate division NC10 bacterium]